MLIEIHGNQEKCCGHLPPTIGEKGLLLYIRKRLP